MSVTTNAEIKRDEAIEHIRQAYDCLSEAVNPHTWGAGNWEDNYADDMADICIELLRINRRLKK